MGYSDENRKSKYLLRALICVVLLSFAIFIQLTFNVFNVFFPAALDTDTPANDGAYVTLTIDELCPTGYRMTSGVADLGSYYYGMYRGRCLFCVLPISADSTETLSDYRLVGKITRSDSAENSILNRISEDHNLNSASLYATSYPFVICRTTAQLLLDLALAAITAITMALSLVLLIVSLVKAARTPTLDSF